MRGAGRRRASTYWQRTADRRSERLVEPFLSGYQLLVVSPIHPIIFLMIAVYAKRNCAGTRESS